MLRIILVTVLVISVNSFSAEADAQSRRTRFFQKVKEDLFGGNAKTEQQKKAANEAAAKQQQLRLQQARARQSAGQPNTGRIPTPVSKNNRNAAAQSRATQLPSLQNPRNTGTAINFSAPGRSPRNSSGANSGSSYRPATRSKRNGFGFQLSLSGEDKLVISSIDRGGNAEESGLKRGDRLIEIGGIEATSVEEFEEIVKVMGQGDEMEFKVKRSGRDKEVSVRFGTLPDIDDVEEAQVSRNTGEKRYDFAPPSSSDFRKSNSVLQPSGNDQDFKSIKTKSNDQASLQIRQLNQRIAEQNRQIRQMQQQLQRMRGGYRGK